MYNGGRENKRMGYEVITTRTMFDQGLGEMNDKSSKSHLMGMNYLYYSRDWLIVTLLEKSKEKKDYKRISERCSLMRTNLSNKSLISADRTNKGTLPLTILRCIFKSSAKDFTSPIFEIIIHWKIRSLSATHPEQHNMIQDTRSIRIQLNMEKTNHRFQHGF